MMPPQSRGGRPSLSPHLKSSPNIIIQNDLEPFPDTSDSIHPFPHDNDNPFQARNNGGASHDTTQDQQSESSSFSESDGDDELEDQADDEALASHEMSADRPVTTPSRLSKPLLNGTDGAHSSSSQHTRESNPISTIPKRPLPSRSQSALPRSSHHPSANAFLAPPFYNRPPTPLPPSPSLTSLLRPPFSQNAGTSHPTTPDSSDTEFAGGIQNTSTTTSTTAAITSSALAAPSSFPRASPRVPTHEYYGFVLYITSTLTFLMYLLWSYLPSPFLHALGLTYYPDRWWSLAIPGWLVMLVAYIYVALACYNTGYLTLAVGNVECLVDEAGVIATIDHTGKILGKGNTTNVSSKRRKTLEKEPRDPTGHSTRIPPIQTRVNDTEDADMKSNKGMPMNNGSENMDWRSVWNIGTDGVMDIPIGGVCEVLYGTVED